MSTSISTPQIFYTSVTVHFCIAISRREQKKAEMERNLVGTLRRRRRRRRKTTALNEVIYRRNTVVIPNGDIITP
jgi:hypothetical protein